MLESTRANDPHPPANAKRVLVNNNIDLYTCIDQWKYDKGAVYEVYTIMF